MKEKKWKIYIVAHNKIIDEMYMNDNGFNNDNYVFLNVGSRELLGNSEKYRCINQYDLENSVKLGKWWAESEGIYNIWRSGAYKDLDYIGFIHYDKELRLIKKRVLKYNNTNITQRINKYLVNRDHGHISFETHKIREDYNQKILADIKKPNILVGEGRNCYDYILDDYNRYFKTQYDIQDLLGKKEINLCSCFLIDIENFEKMMKFWDWIVSSKNLDVFDTEHKYRLQGGLAERYFGVYLMFAYKKNLDLSLIHHYNDGLKEM